MLQSIFNGREYAALPEGVRSTLEFDHGIDSEIMQVDYGCNTGGADVTVTSSTIEYETLFATEIPLRTG